MTNNPWLEGAFAPVASETTAMDLEVVGEIPSWLDGRYLRNGPNPIRPVDPANHHWFVGDAMIHGISLRDGRAEWYRSRFVRTPAVAEHLGVETAPGETHVDMETVNTNVIAFGGRPHAVAEAGARPVELGDELQSVMISDLGGTLPHGYTAHPKVDPITGLTHAITYCWAVPGLEYVVIDTTGRVIHVTTIDVADGPMVHDCAITESSMLVFDGPVTFNLDAAMNGATLPYRWNDDHPNRVGVLPLGGDGSDVQWFEVDPGFVFHPINAYDDDDQIVLDVVRYERIFDRHTLGPFEAEPHWWRWILDLTSGRVSQRQIDDTPVEFPRVDERLVGRRATVGYGTAISLRDNSVSIGSHGVVFDLVNERVETFHLGPDLFAGEWVMIPTTHDSPERGGVLMALGFDRSSERGELLIVDAEAPDDGITARIRLPQRIPIGFHGNWFQR